MKLTGEGEKRTMGITFSGWHQWLVLVSKVDNQGKQLYSECDKRCIQLVSFYFVFWIVPEFLS